ARWTVELPHPMHNSAKRSVARRSSTIATAEEILVCLARLERALNALSTRSLCQLGYRHMEDQAGFEPALGLSQRIKSPPRSAAPVTGPWRTRVVTIHWPTG